MCMFYFKKVYNHNILNLKHFIILLLQTQILITNSKIITRCELATAIHEAASVAAHDEVIWNLLGDWICTAEAHSQLEVNKTSIESSNPNSRSYGLFQISNYWWCQDEFSVTQPDFINRCGINCSELIDDDLSNDIQCAIKIYQAETFKAWDGWIRSCNGTNLDQYRYLNDCDVTPAPVPPTIINEVTNITFIDDSTNQSLNCSGSGTPSPTVFWDDYYKAFPGVVSNTTSYHKDQNSIITTNSLLFPKVSSKYAGEYTCTASNYLNNVKKIFYLNVQQQNVARPSTNGFLPYGIAIGVILGILAIIAISIVIYFKRVLFRLDGLTKSEIQEFIVGDPSKIKSTGRGVGHENIQHLPYNKDFDIPAGLLKFDSANIIGEGQFGFVAKLNLGGVAVAVKSVKPHTDKLYIKALLSELKVMIYIGRHENIVSLIGAVTSELDKGKLLIVVEYCELGDLQGYLRAHKNNFSDGNEKEYENSIMIRDYENTRPITTESLVNWCQQIANGMTYLSSINVIHGDLAARNVLLTTPNYNVKITDFGLSRQLYDYTNYVKKQQAPLPWRHMAIESLQQLTFSVESDIWSFGVTIWEIFSLGDVPYPGRSWSIDFVHDLESGLRLLQPKYAPNHIYSKMMECWRLNKFERPSFKSLTQLQKN